MGVSLPSDCITGLSERSREDLRSISYESYIVSIQLKITSTTHSSPQWRFFTVTFKMTSALEAITTSIPIPFVAHVSPYHIMMMITAACETPPRSGGE